MIATITRNRHQTLTLTTEHAASSYGHPVLLLDGQLQEATIEYSDEHQCRSPLQQIADVAGIWGGGRTRDALADLANEMCPDGIRCGAEIDSVIAEFRHRGIALRATEEED